MLTTHPSAGQPTAVYYSATTGERQKSIPLVGPSDAESKSFWINERHQLYGAYDADFVLWDLATSEERLRLPGFGGNGGLSEYAISPDGSRLAIGIRTSLTESELSLWRHSSSVRATFVDAAIERYLPGLEQFVELGAGYDTRTIQLQHNRQIRCFEVDLPKIQQLKCALVCC